MIVLYFEERIILDRAIFSLSMFDVQKGWRGKRRLGECVDGGGGGDGGRDLVCPLLLRRTQPHHCNSRGIVTEY